MGEPSKTELQVELPFNSAPSCTRHAAGNFRSVTGRGRCNTENAPRRRAARHPLPQAEDESDTSREFDKLTFRIWLTADLFRVKMLAAASSLLTCIPTGMQVPVQ